MTINRSIALRTTVHLFLCIGFVSTVSFILSAHWLLVLTALPVCGLAWFVLYKFEEGIALRVLGSPEAPAQAPEPLPSRAEIPRNQTAPVVIAWPDLLQ